MFENGSFKKRLEFPYTINNTRVQQLTQIYCENIILDGNDPSCSFHKKLIFDLNRILKGHKYVQYRDLVENRISQPDFTGRVSIYFKEKCLVQGLVLGEDLGQPS